MGLPVVMEMTTCACLAVNALHLVTVLHISKWHVCVRSVFALNISLCCRHGRSAPCLATCPVAYCRLGVFLTAGWEPLHAAAAELQAASEGCGTGSQAPQGQQQVGTKAEEQPLGQSCEYGEAAEEPHQKRPRHDGASGSHECVALCVDPSVGDTRDLDVHAEAGCAREDRWCRAYGGWLYLYPRAVPHQLLLPRCALLLHHGGSGTTAAALQCGTPQLLCPLQFDQHYWVRVGQGCGVVVSRAAYGSIYR